MQADIFCRVVDNYGDIGVCWRLARRLSAGQNWRIRLWVDDLRAFARIQPEIDTHAAQQSLQGIEVLRWDDSTPIPPPGEVVIEAFACDPPAAFVARMRDRPPVWVNLEYLSAEDWVESCHAMPSQRPDGLTKYFFFPGFTTATGGLIREPGLSAERDAFQADRAAQQAFLASLGVQDDRARGSRVVSLFCYQHAPFRELAAALSRRSTLLLVPPGVAPGLEEAAGGQLQIARIPFVTQPDFDRLLWCADINFVRGEDSFVRAAWAARPLVWQIYPQEENVHLEKLQAWLDRYPAPAAARALFEAWNAPSGQTDWPALVDAALESPVWPAWQAAARDWDAGFARRPDLGDALADFCAKLLKTR